MNDCFIAFWSGVCAGLVLGIIISATLKVIADTIEREEKK